MESDSRLLILACSQCKRCDANPLPALERYDGPTFRVLRRFLRHKPSASLETYILSAQYGLIPSDHPIPDYDCRMTRQRAQELRPGVSASLNCLLSATPYRELCFCMGQDYFQILNDYEALVSAPSVVTVAAGGTGKRLSVFHDWLYGQPPMIPSPSAPQGRAHIRGIEIVLTPEQVLDVARGSLEQKHGNPSGYQSWYVQVDDLRVSPKWLVSQLTSLPVSAFHSDDARRVLAQLGIEMRHI